MRTRAESEQARALAARVFVVVGVLAGIATRWMWSREGRHDFTGSETEGMFGLIFSVGLFVAGVVATLRPRLMLKSRIVAGVCGTGLVIAGVTGAGSSECSWLCWFVALSGLAALGAALHAAAGTPEETRVALAAGFSSVGLMLFSAGFMGWGNRAFLPNFLDNTEITGLANWWSALAGLAIAGVALSAIQNRTSWRPKCWFISAFGFVAMATSLGAPLRGPRPSGQLMTILAGAAVAVTAMLVALNAKPDVRRVDVRTKSR